MMRDLIYSKASNVIKDSIISISKYSNDAKPTNVAVFSAFARSELEFNYQNLVYQWLKSNDYYVILAIPYFEGIHDIELSNFCDVVIIRENIGYDFGSYACGFAFIQGNEMFSNLEKLMFINDSFIGPFGPCANIGMTSDFWANTESNQVKYHYQSYLFGFNINQHVLECINDFFWKRGDIYSNEKSKVIINFELALYDFFSGKGLECKVIFPISKLRSEFLKNGRFFFGSEMLIGKMIYFLRVCLCSANPTHQLWKELFNCGFPFIKKELFRDNPTAYPLLEKALIDIMSKNGFLCQFSRISAPHRKKINQIQF